MFKLRNSRNINIYNYFTDKDKKTNSLLDPKNIGLGAIKPNF